MIPIDQSTMLALLSTIVETQQEHGKILALLVQALHVPQSGETEIARMLRGLADALKHQSEATAQLHREIVHLPTLVGDALSREMQYILRDL